MTAFGYTIEKLPIERIPVNTPVTKTAFLPDSAMMPLKNKSFKVWLQEMWYQHLDELDGYGMPRPDYTSAAYFQRFRWWLRAEYRRQLK